MRSAVMTLFAVLLLGASAPQREPQLPRIGGETIEVSLVNLDVVVTDRNGERVHGLTATDFEVLEDGKPQEISNFSEFRSRQRTAEAAAAPIESVASVPAAAAPVVVEKRQPRTIILFVDQIRLEPFKRDPVFSAMKEMLHRTVERGDSVSILTWHGEPITALDATSDLAKVDAALDEIAKGTTGVAGNPNADLRRSAVENIDFYRRRADFANGHGYKIDVNAFMPPLDAYEAAIWEKVQVQRKAQAMNAMMNGFAGAPGRKILIIAAHRLPKVAGALGFYSSGQTLTQDRRMEFDTSKIISSIYRTANATGFTIYGIYPEGLGTAFTLPDASQVSSNNSVGSQSGLDFGGVGAGLDNEVYANEMVSLENMARATGGMVAGSALDIEKLLPRLANDFEEYYSLAYHANRRGEDRARDVVVKAKNRDYEVRTRRQVIEKSERTKMQERVIAALFSEPETSAIPLRVQLGKTRKSSVNRYRIPLRVFIPTKELMTVAEQRGAVGGFSVHIAWGGVLGEISDVTTKLQPFTKRDLEGSKGWFTYDFEVVVDDRTDRISVGVMDELGKDFGVARVPLPPRT